MRRFLLVALIGLVPFGNLRMVCFDHPGGEPASGPRAAEPECTDFCLLENRPEAQPESSDTGCVLVAGGCSTVIAVVATPVISSPGLGVPLEVTPVAREVRELYLAPVLARHSPPPKA